MSTDTKIEWCTKTWSPLLGCEQVGDGCTNCYAIRTVHRLSHNPSPKVGPLYVDLTHRTDHGLDWTGKIRTIPERLDDPLKWKKPERVFVNSQSDLFHADVPVEFIAQIFAVMALTPRHAYQILTKRHARMRSVLSSAEFWTMARVAVLDMGYDDRGLFEIDYLRNVHLGVSAENQHWADIRIPALLETPAAVRWVSVEPMLGPVDVSEYVRCGADWLGHECSCCTLDWIVSGGESGPGARPAPAEWHRSLRDQCEAAGAPYLFKQFGAWASTAALNDPWHARKPDAWVNVQDGRTVASDTDPATSSGTWCGVWKVGKHAAGRVLDGRTYDGYPAEAAG